MELREKPKVSNGRKPKIQKSRNKLNLSMMKKHVTLIPFVIIFIIVFISSCSKPYDIIKNRTWEGQIYRLDDDKLLSDVRLKMSNDTLYLFSNAIFGSENDTLVLQKFEEKDSTFTYKSVNGNTFSFSFEYNQTEKSENLYFIGNDYYLVLGASSLDLRDLGALDFYINITVPRDSYMYLDGAYEGEIEMENQFSNMFLAEIGGISIKMVFMDDFKVKIYMKSLFVDMFSGSSQPSFETVDYKVVDNKLFLNKNNSKAQSIEVKNYGETLVLATDKLNVVMHKIY